MFQVCLGAIIVAANLFYHYTGPGAPAAAELHPREAAGPASSAAALLGARGASLASAALRRGPAEEERALFLSKSVAAPVTAPASEAQPATAATTTAATPSPSPSPSSDLAAQGASAQGASAQGASAPGASAPGASILVVGAPVDGVDPTGIASQYAEVNWVMGIQVRRRLGLEPGPEDPYFDIPDAQLQPSFRSGADVVLGKARQAAWFTHDKAAEAAALAAAAANPDATRTAGFGRGNGAMVARPVSIVGEFFQVGSAFALDPLLGGFSHAWGQHTASLAEREMHFVHVPKCGGTSVTKVSMLTGSLI